MMQTAAVTEGIPLGTYIQGKLLQGLFSGFLAAACVWNIWYLSVPVTILFSSVFLKKKKSGSIPLANGV